MGRGAMCWKFGGCEAMLVVGRKKGKECGNEEFQPTRFRRPSVRFCETKITKTSKCTYIIGRGLRIQIYLCLFVEFSPRESSKTIGARTPSKV